MPRKFRSPQCRVKEINWKLTPVFQKICLSPTRYDVATERTLDRFGILEKPIIYTDGWTSISKDEVPFGARCTRR